MQSTWPRQSLTIPCNNQSYRLYLRGVTGPNLPTSLLHCFAESASAWQNSQPPPTKGLWTPLIKGALGCLPAISHWHLNSPVSKMLLNSCCKSRNYREFSPTEMWLLFTPTYCPCPVSSFLAFFSLRDKGSAQQPLQSPSYASSQQSASVLWTQRSPFLV